MGCFVLKSKRGSAAYVKASRKDYADVDTTRKDIVSMSACKVPGFSINVGLVCRVVSGEAKTWLRDKNNILLYAQDGTALGYRLVYE